MDLLPLYFKLHLLLCYHPQKINSEGDSHQELHSHSRLHLGGTKSWGNLDY